MRFTTCQQGSVTNQWGRTMKDAAKCRTEPNPQTSQQAATLLFDGWAAARAGLPNDATMPEAWVTGWSLYWSPGVQMKLLRLELLQ